MHASPIDIQSFQPDHLDAAVELSRQAGWPHRKEDWALVLSISNGFVALENGRVVGTAMATLLGDGCATVNMVIVDEAMRGRGLGRRLMDAAIGATEKRECRLVATADGLPLYQKNGLRRLGGSAPASGRSCSWRKAGGCRLARHRRSRGACGA